MAEYIERETAVKAANEWVSEACMAPVMRVSRLFDKLQKVPAADVAPVVRCEDCKHLYVWNRDVYAFCPKTNIVFLPFELDTRTFSCIYGERKDGGNADENRDPEN